MAKTAPPAGVRRIITSGDARLSESAQASDAQRPPLSPAITAAVARVSESLGMAPDQLRSFVRQRLWPAETSPLCLSVFQLNELARTGALEVSRDDREHLEHCTECRIEVDSIAAIRANRGQTTVELLLSGEACLSEEAILAFRAGKPIDTDAKEHLTHCGACRGALDLSPADAPAIVGELEQDLRALGTVETDPRPKNGGSTIVSFSSMKRVSER